MIADRLIVDRRNGIAVWAQIAQHLRSEISAGALGPGQKLPTENALAESIGVNRHTVRRALDSLEDAGLVRSEQGRGSFVCDHVLDYALGPRTRFSESLTGLADGDDTTVSDRRRSRTLVATSMVKADGAMAKALKLRRGTRVTVLKVLGLVDDRPLSLATHMFASARFPDIARDFAESLSISRAMHAAGINDYVRETTRVTAVLPDPEAASLLEIAKTRPLLRTEAVNVAASGGKPVEFGIALFAADRVQLVVG